MHLDSEPRTNGPAIDLFIIEFNEPFKRESVACFKNTFPGIVFSGEKTSELIAGRWDDEFASLGFWDTSKSPRTLAWFMYLNGISSNQGLFSFGAMTYGEVNLIVDEVADILKRGVPKLRQEGYTPAYIQIHPDVDRLLPKPLWV